MKSLAVFFLACALCASLGCAKQAGSTSAEIQAEDLLHRRFELLRVDGKDLNIGEQERPFIAFGEMMKVNGALCNLFMGDATLENGVLTVPHAASTRRMCGEEDLNRAEMLLFPMLAAGARVHLAENQLILSQGGHEFVYVVKDWVN